MMSQRLLHYQILEKWRKIKLFTSRNISGSKLRTFYCCLAVIYCFETAFKNLGKLRQRGAPRLTLSFKYFTKIKQKNLVLSYDLSHFVISFQKYWRETCPDIRSLLHLCNKELHKKFAPILIVYQRWRHNEKTKTDISFDLDVTLSCGF